METAGSEPGLLSQYSLFAMQPDRQMVECIYITAWARDARYTRICVASVRYFYPDLPIKILAGGLLERGLANDLRYYWNVEMADLPSGEYGWGFVKMEPLFGRPGERFLVLDSDTVMAGPVLDLWGADDEPFLVDDESQTEADTRRLYYDWRLLKEIEPKAQAPAFVFNSGQWFGTAGILSRDDFSPWLEWTMPRRLRQPAIFKQGDQGVFNYILNQKAALVGLNVRRRKIMHWPAHGMDGFSAASVADRTAPPSVIHWAGMKKRVLGAMAGADILHFFEKLYYSRLPGGKIRHFFTGVHYPVADWRHDLNQRIRLRMGAKAQRSRLSRPDTATPRGQTSG
jgi:hypothetical protein